MLEETKKIYLKEAARIKGWENTSVNVLANAYIANENDELLKSGYFAAILLKKWPYIIKHYSASKASGFSVEECYDMVVHGIQYALANRKWKDPSNKLFNDKCAPDKVINRCIASSRDIAYYNCNTQKRKANYGKTSIDMIEENVKDCNTIISDDYAAVDEASKNVSTESLIQAFIKKGKVLEALVLNDIIAGDCFKTVSKTATMIYEEETQKYKKYSQVFKLSKLINSLYNYSDEELEYMFNKYCINDEKKAAIIALFRNTNKVKFTKVVKTLMANLSQDNTLKDYLCL